MRASIHNRLGILGHTTIEQFGSLLVLEADSIEITCTQTTATPDTIIGIHPHLTTLLVKLQTIIGTLRHTLLATTTQLLINLRLTAAMLLGLSCARTASHAYIFNSTSEACHFVTFEVRKTDKDVGIHHCAANLCALDINTSIYRHINIVGTLKAVAYQDRATHR